MEDLIVLIIRGGAEFFFQLLGEGKPFEWIFDSWADWPNLSPSSRMAWICFFQLIFGLIIGAGSVYLFHDLLLRWSGARVLLFATGPVLAGSIPAGFLYRLTAHRQMSFCCFLIIAFFVFGINIARFGYCERPPADENLVRIPR